MVSLLITAGSELGAQASNGQTPLHIAVERQNVDIVKALLEAGADCSICTGDETALHLALRQREPNMEVICTVGDLEATALEVAALSGKGLEPVVADEWFRTLTAPRENQGTVPGTHTDEGCTSPLPQLYARIQYGRQRRPD